MSTQTLSQGPYQVEPLQRDHGASIAICSTGNDARILATIAPENPGEDTDAYTAIRALEDENNARLFAASWSLYQALRRCLDQLAAYEEQGWLGDSWRTRIGLPDDIAGARAALALVDGPAVDPAEPWERRGTMIYTEDTGEPGTARLIQECATVEEAESVVSHHNAADAVRMGGPQPELYLLCVVGDIDPKWLGPFDTEEARFDKAKELKAENGDNDGLFPFDIDSGKPMFYTYSNGSFEDVETCKAATASNRTTTQTWRQVAERTQRSAEQDARTSNAGGHAHDYDPQTGSCECGDVWDESKEYAEARSKGTEGYDRDGEDRTVYLFSVVLEQKGTSKESAWIELLDSIADEPREIIGDYHTAWEAEGETNAQRIERTISGEYTEDTATNITLALADLRQLCDRENWDFAKLDREARDIYEGELHTKGLVKV